MKIATEKAKALIVSDKFIGCKVQGRWKTMEQVMGKACVEVSVGSIAKYTRKLEKQLKDNVIVKKNIYNYDTTYKKK